MKELKDLKAGDSGSIFLEAAKGIAAGTSLAVFAGASGAMVAGHESKVISIDYKEVPANSAPPVKSADGRGQVVRIGDEEIQLAVDGAQPKALTITFESGRTMTVGLLLQGQDKTSVHFTGDAEPTKATDLTLGDLAGKFLNKTFKCVKTYRDNSNEIIRTDPNGVRPDRKYAANCYHFIQTA